MDFMHAAFERALGGFQFQHHAAGNHASLHEALDFLAGNGRDHLFAVQNAGDIGEIDQVIRADEFRASRGHVIGIDIVEFAVRALSEASGHRQQLFAPERFEEGNVDAVR